MSATATNDNRKLATCHRCGHQWHPVKQYPVECPSCHTYDWWRAARGKRPARPRLRWQATCPYCGHHFFLETPRDRVQCGKCRKRIDAFLTRAAVAPGATK